MKKFICMIMCLFMGISCVSVNAAIGESTTDTILPDEIKSGKIIGFDSEEGSFNATTYYVKLMEADNTDSVYALAKNVYFEEALYTAKDVVEILENTDREITYVLRGGKIKYINPYIPKGVFESAEIESCYRVDDKIFMHIGFEYLVGEFMCVAAVYEDDVLCKVQSFDVSYKDAYSYDFEIECSDGEYVKVFFMEGYGSIMPLHEKLISVIE